MQMQDEERRRLARELHDSVGQLLVAINMNTAKVVAQVHRLDDAGARAVRDNVVLVEQISSEIRTISHLLHPPLLDEVGLAFALRWYVDAFSERSRIKTTVDISDELGRLSTDREIAIFRIVQECLTNIHRHSGSKTAAIQVHQSAQGIRVVVQDSGKGIPADKLASSSGQSGGVGFRGMSERIRHLGGTLEVRSDPQEGTFVTADLPLKPAVPADIDKIA
jgi:signal transduction histidine kinase